MVQKCGDRCVIGKQGNSIRLTVVPGCVLTLITANCRMSLHIPMRQMPSSKDPVPIPRLFFKAGSTVTGDGEVWAFQLLRSATSPGAEFAILRLT